MADMGEAKVFEVGAATTEMHVYVIPAERASLGRASVQVWQIATDGRPIRSIFATSDRDFLLALGNAVVTALAYLPAEEGDGGEDDER